MDAPQPLEVALRRSNRAYRRLRRHPAGRLLLDSRARFVEIDARSRIAAIALDMFVALIPLAIIFAAFVAQRDGSHAFGVVLSRRFGLHGRVAAELIRSFPPARTTRSAADIFAIGGFAVAGFDLTAALQSVYAAAWSLETPETGLRASLRGFVWLALGGVFALFLTLGNPAGGDSSILQRVLVEVVVIAPLGVLFWVGTPLLLSCAGPPWRAYLPGAMLSSAALVVVNATSAFYLPSTIDQYFRLFGPVGTAIALLFWLWLVAGLWVTGAIVGAVLWERQNGPVEA